MKLIRAAVSVVRANLDRNFKMPLSVYYLATYRCPYRCGYCNITKCAPSSAELDTVSALSLIDQMAESGTVKLQLTGGEPMMREDIGQIIGRARERDIFCGMSTSGFRIKERIAELKGLDIAFISYDGGQAVHDAIRGAGSHKAAVEAMGSLRSAGINFWTTTVISGMNLNEIEKILETAKKEKFTANFVVLHPREKDYQECFDNDRDRERYLLSDAQQREAIRLLIGKKKSGYPVGTSLPYLEHLLQWEYYSSAYKTKDGPKRCWAGRLYAFMEPDGRLFPCGTFHGAMRGRNTLEEGFKNAFSAMESASCRECLSSCQMEQNIMFSLNLKAICNWYGLLQ